MQTDKLKTSTCTIGNTLISSNVFERLKPKYYIETRWQKEVKYKNKTNVFQYNQPVGYCNGKQRWEYDEQSYEWQNWGKHFWESYRYEEAIKAINFDSSYWKSEKAKEEVFEIVFDFCLKGGSGIGSTITALLPFEIELLNVGFKMVHFCELTALCPMFRTYVKDDKKIIIGFGVKTLNNDGSIKRSVNFYFYFGDNPINFYQVSNDLSKFEAAINGEFEPI